MQLWLVGKTYSFEKIEEANGRNATQGTQRTDEGAEKKNLNSKTKYTLQFNVYIATLNAVR